MGLAYENLDQATRDKMLSEIQRDVDSGALYISNYLNERGCESWATMLEEAAAGGDDVSLARAIRDNNCLNSHHEYDRRTKSGFTRVRAAVPYTAHETMGEGEFNRFYTRGLCARAIEEGILELEVYRAKLVAQPRPESEAKIGMRVDPRVILEDLRSTQGVEPALGLPPGPNSGLTLRIPR